ncbi:CIPK1 [Symbiodinium sp. KB8]|nr:CIPK1 [Symbiodinium sp. KB8]
MPNAITEGCVALVGSQLLQVTAIEEEFTSSNSHFLVPMHKPPPSTTSTLMLTDPHSTYHALQHLHLRRIIHRDVKAENILLLEDPAKTRRWHIKLIDFGLAQRMEHSSSFMFRMCQQEPPLEHLVCGTAYYCAPEVWFHDYSPSVDVWAAGVVLYLAIFGQFPFHDRNQATLEVLICEENREPSYRPICSQDHPGYQASTVAIAALKQLLTKAREDRPDACGAMHLEWFKTAYDSPKVLEMKARGI